MRRLVLVAGIAPVALMVLPLVAQTPRKTPAKPVKPAATTMKREPAVIKCPAELGTGVKTQRVFCDVFTGREPAEGIIVTIPAHTGEAKLSFDLHNRHTYSEEQVRANKAFAQYTATIGVLTLNNDLLTRAVVQSEFRTVSDLFDRIGGGAGPSGVKAVAPTGSEPIAVAIPQKVDQVSILGEKLEAVRLDGREGFVLPGRPIATISNVAVEYRPAPVRTAPVRRRR
jgi:hypothetical protein